MRNYVLLALWLLAFAAPVIVLLAAFDHGGDLVATWLGWPRWASTAAAVGVASVLALGWILLVWPRLLGYRREPAAPPAPAPAPEVAPEVAAAPVAAPVPDEPPPVPARSVSDEEIRRVYADAIALAEAGEDLDACRLVVSLQDQDAERLADPRVGCDWGMLESSADAIHGTDRDAARLVYRICVAQEEWAMGFATAAGEARSAQAAIARLHAKM